MAKFSKEHDVFERSREMWLTEGRAGQYVIIKGEAILGFFTASTEAFEAGLSKFGAGEFFMSVILPSDATDVSFFGIAI